MRAGSNNGVAQWPLEPAVLSFIILRIGKPSRVTPHLPSYCRNELGCVAGTLGLIFHRMPYRFSAWISGKLWPFWFSRGQIVSGYPFETHLRGCVSKSCLQLLIPQFSHVCSLICFSCLRMSCSRCLMISIFYTSKHMTPKKHHFQDSRQYRDFAPKEGF